MWRRRRAAIFDVDAAGRELVEESRVVSGIYPIPVGETYRVGVGFIKSKFEFLRGSLGEGAVFFSTMPAKEIVVGIGNDRRDVNVNIKRLILRPLIDPVKDSQLVTDGNRAGSIDTGGEEGF